MGTLLTRFRIDFLLLLVAASWGSTYLVAKELILPGTVLALLAVRMLLAAGVMAAIVGVRRKPPTRQEVVAGMAMGMLLSGVFVLETFGIAQTSATNAGLIISLTMVFTPVLEAIVLRRRLPATFFAAAVVAVLGVVLLAGNGTFEPPGPGELLVLGAALVRAVHVVGMHKSTAGQAMDSLHLTTVQLGTCALVFTAASFIYGDSIPQYLSRLDAGQGMMLLYLVLICTVFAFFIQAWAVKRTSPSRVSLLLGTEPVWAAVIGITMAQDSIGAAGKTGIALILAGTAWGRFTEQRTRFRPPTRRCQNGAMDISHWWPLLDPRTQQWLIDNNGDAVPPVILDRITAVAGQPEAGASWLGSPVQEECSLSDEAVDWVEKVANDELLGSG